MELREADESFWQKLARQAFLMIVVLGIALLFLTIIKRTGLFNPEKLRLFVEGSGHWGAIVIILLISICAVSITLPSTPVIIIAGALFGPLLGGIYAWIGIMIGSSFAFFIARYFRKYIIGMLGEHAEVLVRFHAKYVAWVVLFTRAIPVFSFEIISYASGLTGISYRWYALATAVGVLPSVILFATSGHLLLEAGGEFLPVIMALVMIVLIFVVPLAIDHYNPWGWKEKLLKGKQLKRQRN